MEAAALADAEEDLHDTESPKQGAVGLVSRIILPKGAIPCAGRYVDSAHFSHGVEADS